SGRAQAPGGWGKAGPLRLALEGLRVALEPLLARTLDALLVATLCALDPGLPVGALALGARPDGLPEEAGDPFAVAPRTCLLHPSSPARGSLCGVAVVLLNRLCWSRHLRHLRTPVPRRSD
ncbi:MAG: hypothetical protein PHZ19_09730, partial [Candidatus Thermoplasmatota archaeon]|nr:hypothetical protein [Candidatus Thermoplasmatota archaeon]